DAGSPADAGPLAGVPIAVKDDGPVAGQPMTFGSRSPAQPEPADAEFLKRLRAAGAIPLGITNVPELMLFPWTASDANGVTRNPWDPSRTPGGSSGGSAAALAAGLVAAATGSDGGGSIRIPAACCGLVGMKPTRGRTSRQPYADADAVGLSVYGALARTVTDSALLLDVIHGTTAGDVHSAPAPRGSFHQAALTVPDRPLRVAVSRKIPVGVLARLSSDQRLAWERTARLLSELGHELVERDPDYGFVSLEFVQTYLRAAYEGYAALAQPDLAEASTRQFARFGGRVVPERRRDRVLARRPRTTIRITSLWDDCDVLLTPGLATSPVAAEGGYGRSALVAFNKAARFIPWYPVFNLTGQPAISLPAGFGSDGLPLSVQLVGRIGAEETLYSLSGQIEAARPWAVHRPSIAA
ncbi:MAG: amidase family protein, partial [Conexibacteraceae bacterium]|nr:amidase family protein [Conexibacteraceae bacterium]